MLRSTSSNLSPLLVPVPRFDGTIPGALPSSSSSSSSSSSPPQASRVLSHPRTPLKRTLERRADTEQQQQQRETQNDSDAHDSKRAKVTGSSTSMGTLLISSSGVISASEPAPNPFDSSSPSDAGADDSVDHAPAPFTFRMAPRERASLKSSTISSSSLSSSSLVGRSSMLSNSSARTTRAPIARFDAVNTSFDEQFPPAQPTASTEPPAPTHAEPNAPPTTPAEPTATIEQKSLDDARPSTPPIPSEGAPTDPSLGHSTLSSDALLSDTALASIDSSSGGQDVGEGAIQEHEATANVKVMSDVESEGEEVAHARSPPASAPVVPAAPTEQPNSLTAAADTTTTAVTTLTMTSSTSSTSSTVSLPAPSEWSADLQRSDSLVHTWCEHAEQLRARIVARRMAVAQSLQRVQQQVELIREDLTEHEVETVQDRFHVLCSHSPQMIAEWLTTHRFVELRERVHAIIDETKRHLLLSSK